MELKTYFLNDTDGFMQRFLTVVAAEDIFTEDVVRTVFAWGHPVVKIVTTPASDTTSGMYETTWWWIGLDLGPEMKQTRHREVVANFLRDTGMLTPVTTPEELERTGESPVEDAMESFASALGTDEEAYWFTTLAEMIGEHEPDQFVDRVVDETPYFVDEVE